MTQPRPPLKRKMVVIEDGMLVSMAANEAIAAEFPFLKPVLAAARTAARGGGCGSCGQAARTKAAAYRQAKLNLAGLPSDKKRRLKELLNAQAVRLLYKDAANRAQQLTF